MLIPQRLVNCRLYGGTGGTELLGITDLELPKFEAITETIAGAGIAGEVDSPVLGHFKSMVLKAKLRTPTPAAAMLLAPVLHVFDARGSLEHQDPQLGAISTVAARIEARGTTKVFNPGKFEPGKSTETEFELEVTTLRLSVGGVSLVELDKLNFSFIVNGVDYLRSVRADLGGV